MKNIKKLCGVMLPSIFLIAFHILFTQLAYIMSYPKEEELLIGYNAIRHIIVSAVIFVCFYYSFVRVQTVYNKTLREKYLAAEGNIRLIPFILSSLGFWTDLIVYTAVALCTLGKAYSFLYDIFCANGNAFGRLYALAATVPILAVTGFIARYNATKIWNRTLDTPEATTAKTGKTPSHKADKLIPTIPSLAAMRFITRAHTDRNPALEPEDALPFDYGKGGKTKAYMLVFSIFAFCSICGTLIYTVISFVLVPFFMLSYAKYAAAILITTLVAVPVIRRIKALIKRARLVSKTKSICKQNKYKLSTVKSPYASLFSHVNGESFKLTVNGETFSCKLLGCKKASLPIILREDGSGDIVHSVTFAGVKWFERKKPFRYGYESKYRQILIINPSAKFICRESNGTIQEIDNGDCIGNYIVYSGSGFTNALDRNVLGVTSKTDKYR